MFPAKIVVSIFWLLLSSTIVPGSITIFVSPLIVPKFPNVNVYPITSTSLGNPAFAASVVSCSVFVISVKVFACTYQSDGSRTC